MSILKPGKEFDIYEDIQLNTVPIIVYWKWGVRGNPLKEERCIDDDKMGKCWKHQYDSNISANFTL